jgi:cytochrome c-type biogenesis protein CcmF
MITALAKLKRPLSFQRLGMILAHCGFAFAVLGATLTTTLETEKDLPMRVGQRITLSGYTFIFQALKDIKGPNYEGKQGHFTIYRDQQPIADLYPEKRFYIPREVAMTETAIKAGFLRDFYIALGEKLDDRWSVRLYIKPFIRWVWLGGLLIALGAGCISFVSFREHLSKRAE